MSCEQLIVCPEIKDLLCENSDVSESFNHCILGGLCDGTNPALCAAACPHIVGVCLAKEDVKTTVTDPATSNGGGTDGTTTSATQSTQSTQSTESTQSTQLWTTLTTIFFVLFIISWIIILVVFVLFICWKRQRENQERQQERNGDPNAGSTLSVITGGALAGRNREDHMLCVPYELSSRESI